jgi:bacterial/archaeal transporter family protein
MGGKNSTPAQRSPAAAFGRLRIDSPAPRRPSPRARGGAISSSSYNNLVDIGQVTAARYHDFTTTTATSEQSPLLLQHGRELRSHRGIHKNASGPSLSEDAIPPAWWIVPALVCALCYAFYNIFIKLGSATIHPMLGGVILQFVAAIFGSILIGILISKEGVEELNYDASGIQWAMCAGVAVGAAEMLSFVVSGLGVPASKSIPIIIGGSVGFGCVLGMVLLREVLSYQSWFGIILIVIGVTVVGMDPSGAGATH